MGESFHLRGLKLIRSSTPLSPNEFGVLEYLINCAERGQYWDRLYRIAALEDVPFIIQNIVAKARMAGLEPHLEKLKEEVDAEASVI
jgi:hypothetical protein